MIEQRGKEAMLLKYIALQWRHSNQVIYTNSEEMKERIQKLLPDAKVEVIKCIEPIVEKTYLKKVILSLGDYDW